MRPLRFQKRPGVARKRSSTKPDKGPAAKTTDGTRGISLRQIMRQNGRLPFSVVRYDSAILYEIGETFTEDAFGKIDALLADGKGGYDFVNLFELDLAETAALKEFRRGETQSIARNLELDPATLEEGQIIESGAPYRCNRGWLSVHQGIGPLTRRDVDRVKALTDGECVLAFVENGANVIVPLGDDLIFAMARRQVPTPSQVRWLEQHVGIAPAPPAPVDPVRETSADAPAAVADAAFPTSTDDRPVKRQAKRPGPRPAEERKKVDSYFQRGLGVLENAQSQLDGSRRAVVSEEQIEQQREVVNETFEMVMGDADLASALLNQPTNKECFVEHAFKTQILAIEVATEMARSLTLTRTEVKQVGLAGLLQDVSLLHADYEPIVTKARPLVPREWERLIAHPDKSLEAIETCDLPRIVKDLIAQGHEKLDGTGYPRGIRGQDINPLAKLLTAVNGYVAMISPRPHRPPMDPHRAMTKLVLAAHHGHIDRDVVRAMLGLLSIYPVGTLVKLDTGEIARVVSANVANSFRPVVAVIRDRDGMTLAGPRTMNLMEEYFF